jgi:hypothetical protein
VILTTPEEWSMLLSGPWETASKLQRALPDGALKIVTSGEREDPPPSGPDSYGNLDRMFEH